MKPLPTHRDAEIGPGQVWVKRDGERYEVMDWQDGAGTLRSLDCLSVAAENEASLRGRYTAEVR